METVSISANLTVMTCSCGIIYAVPEIWRKEKERNHATWWCPNGCPRHYPGESDIEKAKRERTETEQRLQSELNAARHLKLVAERARDKAVKDKRKVERRVAHGVCPCCNKTFNDLSNHMVTEHKDFRLPAGKKPAQITAAS